MSSLWSVPSEQPKFETLQNPIKTDVLIIGGGIAGIMCAYLLKQAGVDCVLAEEKRICDGITKTTTAKITAHHGAIFDKMIRRFGAERTRLYYESQQAAVEQYRGMCKNIDCDFEEKDSYVYSLCDRAKMEKEVQALALIGSKAEFAEHLPLPFSVAGAVRMGNQAQFHPLKFAYGIAKDLPIYENTKVLEVTPHGAVTQNGTIAADHIIVATHFPFINKHGMYFLKMYQHRSYVIALKNVPDVHGMYVDEAKEGMSFRNYGEFLLIGGGSHRTGKTGGNWLELSRFAQKYYPDGTEVCRWATQDCMTLDDIPYIGRYSQRTRNLYVAAGFNKWGMSSSMTAAMLLRDLILGRQNPCAAVYSPSRSMLRPQLAINIFESLIGILTPTVPRCPHLGCALKYNKAEHSWDCSCHGSRFTERGKRINNPATGDKKL